MTNTKIYKKRRNVTPLDVILAILLIIYTISIVLMFLWAINSSLKTKEIFDFDRTGITKSLEWKNYSTAYLYGFKKQVYYGDTTRYVYIEEMFFNSLMYAGGGAFLQVCATVIVAYLTAKYDNVFSKILHSIIIITMILPIVGALPSEIRITNALGIKGTFLCVWIMKFGFTNIYYLIFHSAFKNIPWSYAESAFMDGANHFQVFFKIMIPLVKSLINVVFIIFFIQYWNDYQTPMIFLDKHPVLALGLYEFFQSYEQELSTPTIKIAGGIIVLIPLLILFFIFKNKLMGNLTEGGIKS